MIQVRTGICGTTYAWRLEIVKFLFDSRYGNCVVLEHLGWRGWACN